MTEAELTDRQRINWLLQHVLTHEGVGRWWDTPVPELHNATPEQCMAAGDVAKVQALAESYISDGGFT